MAARRDGMRTMTATCARSACSISCATRSGWCRRSAFARSTAVVGHDFGASVAAWCALVRPDVFRAVTLMSAPFAGPPPIPFDTVNAPAAAKAPDRVHADLAALARPRKHYQWFYSTREANADMQNCSAGRACLHARLLSSQERRLAGQQAVSARRMDRGRTGEAADLLRHGSRQGHGGDGRRAHADGGSRSPRANG